MLQRTCPAEPAHDLYGLSGIASNLVYIGTQRVLLGVITVREWHDLGQDVHPPDELK